ncbi:MAG: hypothetical protein AAFR82_01085 [Pseudomonadota bacterium]
MAAAAPWVQEDDGLYARVSLAQEDVEGLSGWRADAYAEYGLTSRLTATAKIERVNYRDASDFNTDGWRSTLRLAVLDKGPIVVSVEAGLLQGAAIGGRNGCEKIGTEVRTGIGWSGLWRQRSTYLFGELAGRVHEDCQRQRYAFGLGQQTSEHFWSVTQVWLERGDGNAASDKFQTELLWRAKPADFSFGYRNENGGLFEEESIFIALARQF